MRIDSERTLFVGLRIDNKMRDQLGSCAPRDKAYFDGSDPRYLLVLHSKDDSYVGKLVDPGTPATGIEDLRRNILSILLRIAPGRHREDAVKVFAVDGERTEGITPLPIKASDDLDVDPGELADLKPLDPVD